MRPLRAGIVGCGVVSKTHSEAFRKLPDIELGWACDLQQDKADALSEKYGYAKTTTDYKVMFADDDLDVVSVCTDHASHAEICVAALEAGKHVLCEKALSSTTEGIDQMLAASAANESLVFGGVFQHRFDAANQYIHQLVEQGVFGIVLTAGLRMYCKRTNDYYTSDDWRGTWDKEGGGVMINQAIHYVDLLAWLMGRVDSVCGSYTIRTHQGAIETEDTVTAALRFGSGALGIIEATSSSEIGWHPSFWIHGNAGRLQMCNGKIQDIGFTDSEVQKKVEAGLAECRDRPGVETRKTYYGTGHVAQIEDFVSAVLEKRAPYVPAVQAAHAVDLVLGVYRSQRDGAWIDLPKRSG
jgi:predicted dehydrogenase